MGNCDSVCCLTLADLISVPGFHTIRMKKTIIGVFVINNPKTLCGWTLLWEKCAAIVVHAKLLGLLLRRINHIIGNNWKLTINGIAPCSNDCPSISFRHNYAVCCQAEWDRIEGKRFCPTPNRFSTLSHTKTRAHYSQECSTRLQKETPVRFGFESIFGIKKRINDGIIKFVHSAPIS